MPFLRLYEKEIYTDTFNIQWWWIKINSFFVSQFFLSYVATLPSYDAFRQCLLERAHAFFSVYPLVESYFAPLIVVLLTYTPIFFRVCRQFEKVAASKYSQICQLLTLVCWLCQFLTSMIYSVCSDAGQGSSSPRDSIDKVQVEGVKITFAFALVVILCYTPQISLIVW